MAHGGTTDSALGETDHEVDMRLQSFHHKWTGKKEKLELARAGFTFTGSEDKVECGQCGLKLLNWTSTDDPLHEHATRRPLCPFINSRYRQLGQRKPPKHPQYQQLQARLDSFVAWPGRYVPKTPEELAAAGFFYIGSADRVTCFQCGITLRDWEEEHDPVTEHQRYSENCQFINKTDVDQLGVEMRPDKADGSQSAVDRESDINANREHVTGALSDFRNFNSIKQAPFNCQTTKDIAVFESKQSNPHTNTSTTTNTLSASSIKSTSPFMSTSITSTSTLTKSKSITPTSSVTKEGTEDCAVSNDRNPVKISSLKLAQENKRLREKGTCRVCREKGVATLFLPCGHLVTCSECAPKVSECIVCDKIILGTVKKVFRL